MRHTSTGHCSSIKPSADLTSSMFPLKSALPISVSRVMVVPLSPTCIEMSFSWSILKSSVLCSDSLSTVFDFMNHMVPAITPKPDTPIVMSPAVVPKLVKA